MAIDVGGTQYKAGLVTEAGIDHMTTGPTGPGCDPGELADQLGSVVRTIREAADRPVDRVGLAAPGRIDAQRGLVVDSHNLQWRDVPLVRLVQQSSGLPTALEHDVYLGGFAELRRGAGLGFDDVLYVGIGTGIACALVSTGLSWRGERGFAGELGLGLTRDSRRVEDAVSARALCASYRAATGAELAAHSIVDRIDVDPAARTCWLALVEEFGHALWNCIALVDPGCVVIGGGLSLAGPRFLEPLEESLAKAEVQVRPLPPIRLAGAGLHAACLGAGLHTLELAV